MTRRLLGPMLGLLLALPLGVGGFAAPAKADHGFFEMPAALPPQIVPDPDRLVGQTLQIVDEEGPIWLDLRAGGVVATVDDYGRPFTGSWHIDRAGHLCLRSRVWWRRGTCFALYGVSLDRLDGVVSQRRPGHLYPASIYPTDAR